MNTPKLKLFSDAHLLRQIDRPLLTEFLERFNHLLPSKYFLSNPRPDNEAYFDSLALVLDRTCELPDDLAQALFEVEALAAPENHTRLHAALGEENHHTEDTPLSQAIRAWLRSPLELKISLSSVGSTGGEDGPALQRL